MSTCWGLGKFKKPSLESCKGTDWTLSWGLSGYLQGLRLSSELLGAQLAAPSGDRAESMEPLHPGACSGRSSPRDAARLVRTSTEQEAAPDVLAGSVVELPLLGACERRLNGLLTQERWHPARFAHGELELRFLHFLCGREEVTWKRHVLMRTAGEEGLTFGLGEYLGVPCFGGLCGQRGRVL